jgi:hypothetical protein
LRKITNAINRERLTARPTGHVNTE